MKVQVLIRLKAGVLDVQGKAVERSLTGLGFDDVNAVRIGRLIEMEVGASNLDKAKQEVTKMCQELLVNPIIESYEIREAK